MEEPHLLLGERGFISPLGNPSRSLALLKLASARVIKYFMDLLDRRGFQDKSAPVLAASSGQKQLGCPLLSCHCGELVQQLAP